MNETPITLIGNLCADPELSFTAQGTPVANLRLAVTARVRDGDDWKDGPTSFYRVTCWRSLATHVVPELAPGSPEVVLVGVRG